MNQLMTGQKWPTVGQNVQHGISPDSKQAVNTTGQCTVGLKESNLRLTLVCVAGWLTNPLVPMFLQPFPFAGDRSRFSEKG